MEACICKYLSGSHSETARAGRDHRGWHSQCQDQVPVPRHPTCIFRYIWSSKKTWSTQNLSNIIYKSCTQRVHRWSTNHLRMIHNCKASTKHLCIIHTSSIHHSKTIHKSSNYKVSRNCQEISSSTHLPTPRHPDKPMMFACADCPSPRFLRFQRRQPRPAVASPGVLWRGWGSPMRHRSARCRAPARKSCEGWRCRLGWRGWPEQDLKK